VPARWGIGPTNTKGRIMTDYDSLIEYRDAAWRCNDAAQNVLAAFSAENAFSTEEAKTAFRISWTAELKKAADQWQAAAYITKMANGIPVFEAVKDAVGLQATPILVGKSSFLTAHDAAGYYAEVARDYLKGERDKLPALADLYAQIEKEAMQAITTLAPAAEDDDEDKHPIKPDENLIRKLRGNGRKLLLLLWGHGNINQNELWRKIWGPKYKGTRKRISDDHKTKTIDRAVNYLNRRLEELGYHGYQVQHNGGLYYLNLPQK
jgi:hypothetical protein